MKQILHIFRKDTRHFWPEIIVELFLLFLVVTHYPVRWHPVGGAIRTQQIYSIVTVLMVILPLSWCVIVGRLIHSESLVGEKQFWITRPYRWYWLMAAKALFVFVWIGVPTFLAEYALLAEAGLHPQQHIGDLLLEVILVLVVVLLPVIAASTITSNLARLAIALLATGVVVSVFGLSSSVLIKRMVVQPHSYALAYRLIIVLFTAAVILVQYRSRRIWIARGLWIGLFVCLAATAVGLQSSADAIADRTYATTNASLRIAYQQPDPTKQSGFEMLDNDVEAIVPIAISGMADGSAVSLENARYTIEGPGGIRYSSPWHAQAQYPPISASDHTGHIDLVLPYENYEQLQNAPVHLHITLGLMSLKATGSTTVKAEYPDFEVPGVGVCSSRSTFRRNGMFCRSAVRDVPLTMITMNWSSKPCTATSLTQPRTTWFGSLNPTLGSESVALQQWFFSRDRVLCTGTPVTFTRYAAEGRSQIEVDIPDFTLPQEGPDGPAKRLPKDLH